MLSPGDTLQNLEVKAETIFPRDICESQSSLFLPSPFQVLKHKIEKQNHRKKFLMIVLFPLVCSISVIFFSGVDTKPKTF